MAKPSFSGPPILIPTPVTGEMKLYRETESGITIVTLRNALCASRGDPIMIGTTMWDKLSNRTSNTMFGVPSQLVQQFLDHLSRGF